MNRPQLKAILLISMILSITIVAPALNSRAQDDPTPQPAEIAIDSLGFEMVYVPEGTFEMGIQQETLESFIGHPIDENGLRLLEAEGVLDFYEVQMESFWIDRYEVTIEQYTQYFPEIMDESGIGTRPELIDTPQNPIVAVTWLEAVHFCSIRYAHLPTEEEWEYAASGPENLLYPWGDIFDENNIHVSGEGTYPVGSKPGNVSWIGAYDMAGNAAEWVENRFLPYSPSEMSSREIGTDTHRVIRGGGYDNLGLGLATFSRYSSRLTGANIFTGFRCARFSDPRLD